VIQFAASVRCNGAVRSRIQRSSESAWQGGWLARPEVGQWFAFGRTLLRRLLFKRRGPELASVDRGRSPCWPITFPVNPSSAGGHDFHLCPPGAPLPTRTSVPVVPLVCSPLVTLGNISTTRPSSNVYQVYCFGTEPAPQSLGVIHRTCMLAYTHDYLGITPIRYWCIDDSS
jgi:hypothetical protein